MEPGKTSKLTRRAWLECVSAGSAAAMAGGASAARAVETAPASAPPNVASDVKPWRIPASYYQHFDADPSLPVPEESFGGWKKAELEFSRANTALVVMHAWDTGQPGEFPGWVRCVPYQIRANAILRDVFPPLLGAVRESGLPVFHVAGGGRYYQETPGYKHALDLAGPPPRLEPVAQDPIRRQLEAFRGKHGFVGEQNREDVARGSQRLGFAQAAKPRDTEGVAECGEQLFALCKEKNVNHLVYIGFAINWCLLMSPGGMVDMTRYGVMCSTIREATTAVENKESAPNEFEKSQALWRVALDFGFVFDLNDFVQSLQTA